MLQLGTEDGSVAPEIEVQNGLHQGTIDPTHFNLFFNLVIGSWREPFGVDVLYKHGGKLVGERTGRQQDIARHECQTTCRRGGVYL